MTTTLDERLDKLMVVGNKCADILNQAEPSLPARWVASGTGGYFTLGEDNRSGVSIEVDSHHKKGHIFIRVTMAANSGHMSAPMAKEFRAHMDAMLALVEHLETYISEQGFGEPT